MANYFPDEFLQEVLTRNDIVDVVGESVRLARRGGNYWGCCPFHNEKTASFSVSPDKQFFYCFGCHKGGNAFQFVQAMERCDFGEAVEQLAARANLQLPQMRTQADQQRDQQRERLFALGKQAARYFHEQLYAPAGAEALAYLRRRGLSDGTVRRFGLGWAPDQPQALQQAMEEAGFTSDEMQAFALCGQRDGRRFDYFRDRVMFPIIDRRGRVIAFGGRVLDDAQPKYLNSPDTPVFNKRNNLYGLNLALKAKSEARVVMVEGYMDVISLHQTGLDVAVASLGTALTQSQAALLKRYERVYIAYDGDTAGQRATLRGMDILRAAELDVYVVSFPDGMDPDDFARARGMPGLEEALAQAKPLFQYKLDQLRAQYDMDTQQGRADYAKQACAEVLRTIESPVEREVYVQQVANQTGIDKIALHRESGTPAAHVYAKASQSNTSAERNRNAQKPLQELSKVAKAQAALLSLALQSGEYAPVALKMLQAAPPELSSHRQIAEVLRRSPGREAKLLLLELDEDAGAELTRLLQTDVDALGDKRRLLEDCAQLLAIAQIKTRMDKLVEELRSPLPERQRDEYAREYAQLSHRCALMERNGAQYK